jgi:hypothetical protein
MKMTVQVVRVIDAKIRKKCQARQIAVGRRYSEWTTLSQLQLAVTLAAVLQVVDVGSSG